MITLRKYQDKRVAVVGLAKAGTATVASLLAGGAKVFAWDDKEESRKVFAKQFTSGVQLSPPAEWSWKDIDALVLSPGVPLTHPKPHEAVVLAQRVHVRIIGDIELLSEAQPHAKRIAITGTNGKSTTTALIGHILTSNGQKAQIGGNLGTPALALAPLGAEGTYVLEVSSYQLDLLEKAHFTTALLLNITPDHIDRHGGIEGYVFAKSHIFDRQTASEAAVVGIDDDYSRSLYAELKQRSKARLIGISVQNDLKHDVYVDREGMLHDKLDPEHPVTVPLTGLPNLVGRHNWQNAAFAYTACRLHGIASRDIEKSLKTFPGLRHRLQIVATLHGVRFINDSKATNADATSHALAPFNNIYWIVGGKPKEGGIETLTHFFPNIAHAFLVGEAEATFAKTLEGRVPYTRCGTLAKAFEVASTQAFDEHKPNAVVLLSPACASFDQWKNFEERGDAFCSMAERLLDKIIKGKR